MTADTWRDQIAAKLHDQGCIETGACGGICRDDADAVLPILHDAVAEARADTAEAIVREMEATEHRCGDCGVLLDATYIADIARQHGKDQP